MSNLARGFGNESGFTLTELLVASFVMLIVTTALFTSLEQTEVLYEDYSADIDLRQKARVALAQFGDETRLIGYDVGDIDETLTIGSSDEFQFLGDVDAGDDKGACDSAAEAADGGGVERVTYTFDSNAGTLARQVDCWDGSSWSNGVLDSVVLDGLHSDGLTFRYFDSSGTQLAAGGTLTSAEREQVRSVSLEIAIDDDFTDALMGDEERTDLSLTTRVKLQNRGHDD